MSKAMAREFDHLFKLLIIGDSGEWARPMVYASDDDFPRVGE